MLCIMQSKALLFEKMGSCILRGLHDFLSGGYCSNTEVQCGHRVASGDISDLQ